MVIDAVIYPRYWQYTCIYIYIRICSFQPLGHGQLQELEIHSNKCVVFRVEFFPEPRAFGAFSKWVCLKRELVWKYTDFSVHHFGYPFSGSASPSSMIFRWASISQSTIQCCNHTQKLLFPLTYHMKPSVRFSTSTRSTSFSKKTSSWIVETCNKKTVGEGCGYVENIPVSLLSPKLTVRTWRLTVGRRLPFWKDWFSVFRCELLVSGRIHFVETNQ